MRKTIEQLTRMQRVIDDAFRDYVDFVRENADQEKDPHIPNHQDTPVGELLGFLLAQRMASLDQAEGRMVGDGAPMPHPYVVGITKEIESRYDPENDLIPETPPVTATDHKLLILIKDLQHRVLDLEMAERGRGPAVR